LGVKPIDTVIVNPLASVGVKERGSLRKKMMGQGERVLFLGLGTLPSMTIGQFRAILAHEYGHFAHRDTSGGNLAKRVDFSIHSIVVNLAGSGLAHWYNPAWLFVSGYYRIYKRITLGASRLHETLADRYAVIAYGKEDLIDGIRHVIHQQLVFLRQLDLEIKNAVEVGRDLNNVYSLPDIEEETEIVKLKEAYESLLNRPTSPYDSHPAPIDRFRMIEQLEGIPQVQTDPSPAWDLIDDIANLQLKMTRVIQQRIPQLQSQPDEIA
jgi:Zn-dependent protease with chaperone function